MVQMARTRDTYIYTHTRVRIFYLPVPSLLLSLYLFLSLSFICVSFFFRDLVSSTFPAEIRERAIKVRKSAERGWKSERRYHLARVRVLRLARVAWLKLITAFLITHRERATKFHFVERQQFRAAGYLRSQVISTISTSLHIRCRIGEWERQREREKRMGEGDGFNIIS